MDSALLQSVRLIETALQCEMVAENPRCQVPARGLGDCRLRQTYSRRDVLGCSREDREKNGSTTSKKKTVTTPTPIPRVLDDSPTSRSKKPHPASALGVRTNKRQEPLDKTGSFREVPPARFPQVSKLGKADRSWDSGVGVGFSVRTLFTIKIFPNGALSAVPSLPATRAAFATAS